MKPFVIDRCNQIKTRSLSQSKENPLILGLIILIYEQSFCSLSKQYQCGSVHNEMTRHFKSFKQQSGLSVGRLSSYTQSTTLVLIIGLIGKFLWCTIIETQLSIILLWQRLVYITLRLLLICNDSIDRSSKTIQNQHQKKNRMSEHFRIYDVDSI